MVKLNTGLCAVFAFCGTACAIFGYAAFIGFEKLIYDFHESKISASKADLSQSEAGGIFYEIKNQDSVFVYKPPVRNLYDFSTELAYIFYNNVNQFQAVPFSEIKQKEISNARNKGCIMAMDAQKKYMSMDADMQEDTKQKYESVQAFHQQYCR